ncbi:putative membrane protein [Arthrobacter sp. 2762]
MACVALGLNDYWGVVMNLSPTFGIIGILYAVFVIAVTVLAVYALVLAIIFLRLRIAELKRAARAEDN